MYPSIVIKIRTKIIHCQPTSVIVSDFLNRYGYFIFCCFNHSFLSFKNYYCYTGGTVWHLPNFMQYITAEFKLFIICSHLSHFPALLEQFQQFSYFHFDTWWPNISTIFTLLHTFPESSYFPLVSSPRKDLFYLPVLHF
jgi:hypothetical protein